MQLDGKRLKAAAESLNLSLSDIQERSGLSAAQVAYYWNSAVTITSAKDVAVLATLLQVNVDDLLVQGETKDAMLQPDKFTSEAGDIVIKMQRIRPA